MISGGGNDIFFAFRDNDIVLAGDGRDKVFAGEGNDLVNGSVGNDIIIGGEGSDRMFGSADEDISMFGPGSDHDKVFGFRTGSDPLDVSAYRYESFEELSDNTHQTRFGTTIELDDSSVFLAGVRASGLDSDVFIFAGEVPEYMGA